MVVLVTRVLLELCSERKKEALSSLLYVRDEEWPERVQVMPGVPLYRQGPGGYNVVGARLSAGPAGFSPAGGCPGGEPVALIRPDSLGTAGPRWRWF